MKRFAAKLLEDVNIWVKRMPNGGMMPQTFGEKALSKGDPVVVLEILAVGGDHHEVFAVVMGSDFKLYSVALRCLEAVPDREMRRLLAEGTLVETEASGRSGGSR